MYKDVVDLFVNNYDKCLLFSLYEFVMCAVNMQGFVWKFFYAPYINIHSYVGMCF